jgi:hypothetical protein
MHTRRYLLLAAVLGLSVGLTLSPAPPARAQVRLDVVGSSFYARQVMSGTELVITALVRNPSDTYVYHVSGRYSLKIGGQEVATARAGFALKDVLAPGETTVLQKTVGHERALEVDEVEIPFVVTDETTVASYAGYAPPPTVVRLDRGHAAHWGDHYLAELRNDSLVDYFATSTEVAAVDADAVFYQNGKVVGIAVDGLILPEGHVARGQSLAARFTVPASAANHDDVELYFSVRQLTAPNVKVQSWAVESPAFAVEGSGASEQLYVTADLRNSSAVDGDPDLAFLLKDAAGRLLGLLHCPIDLLLMPDETIACKEAVPAAEISGPVRAVAAITGMAMSHVLVGPTPSPTRTVPVMTCTPPACPCGRLVGICPNVRCEVCTATVTPKPGGRILLPMLRKGE